MKRIILLIAIFFSVGYAFGQNRPCEPGSGLVFCRGACRLPRACGIGPPPPGLVVPIDSNIIWLLAAGLGLGIYYWLFLREKPVG